MTWLKIKPIIIHIICLTRPEYLPGIEIKVKIWDVDLWCQQVHDHKMWKIIKRWEGGDSVRKPASGSFQEEVHLWKLLRTTLIFLLSGQLNACEVYCNSDGPKNDDEKMQLLSINHPLRAQRTPKWAENRPFMFPTRTSTNYFIYVETSSCCFYDRQEVLISWVLASTVSWKQWKSLPVDE